MSRLSGPLVAGVQRPSVLQAQIARLRLETRRHASRCTRGLVVVAAACGLARAWPVLSGCAEGLLVGARCLRAAARALVKELGSASSPCVRGRLAVGERPGVGNVLSLVIELRHRHLGRYFLSELALLGLERDITACGVLSSAILDGCVLA